MLLKKKPWAVTFPDCFSINTDVVLEAFRSFGNGLSIIPQTPTRWSVMKRVIRIVITAARSDLYWVRGKNSHIHARTHTHTDVRVYGRVWVHCGETKPWPIPNIKTTSWTPFAGHQAHFLRIYSHPTSPPRVKESQASQPRRATDLQKTVVGKE